METLPISPLGPVKLAITMDDLLLFRGAPYPPRYTPMGIVQSMTEALASHRVGGAYAFSNTAPAEDDPELLDVFGRWLEAGHHIGNHTHHHASLNWVDAKTYIGDIERAESMIARWLDRAPLRTFRFCMDMWGDTAEKRDAVQDYLARARYVGVPISIGFHDARYVTPYWRTLKRDDRDGAAWMRRGYIESAVHELRLHAANARAVFGRDPIHIWLIHGTPIAGDCLAEILDRFEAANVMFVPLNEALADPMNAMIPPRISPEFIHQVEKWALVRGIPVDDRAPAFLDEAEKLHLAPGESSVDTWRVMTGFMAERLGARIAPFPLADCQR